MCVVSSTFVGSSDPPTIHLVVHWQNELFKSFHQSRSVLSPNPIDSLSGQVVFHDRVSKRQVNGARCFSKTPLVSFDEFYLTENV